MKVLFVSPSFYPATYYGGPIYINHAFAKSLAKTAQVQLKVLTTDADGPNRRIGVEGFPVSLAERYKVYYCRRIFHPDISPGLLLRLAGMIREADIVHLNAVYSFTTLPTLALCQVFRRPVVWSPLGALQRYPGTSQGVLKSFVERVSNWFCARDRVLLHLTSEDERHDSIGRISSASSVVIRNGIEVPNLEGISPRQPAKHMRLLYVGRLHPIKGIENLLRALTFTKTPLHLSICGEGEMHYENHLRSLVADLKLSDHVDFCGRVDDIAKEQQFIDADICIVPSFTESFCTVVVESLARGLPVIASNGTPWQRLEEMNCGMWVSNDPEHLAKAIDQAAVLPLEQMGLRGKAWMQSEYSWEGVTAEMITQYRSLIELSDKRRHRATGQTQAA